MHNKTHVASFSACKEEKLNESLFLFWCTVSSIAGYVKLNNSSKISVASGYDKKKKKNPQDYPTLPWRSEWKVKIWDQDWGKMGNHNRGFTQKTQEDFPFANFSSSSVCFIKIRRMMSGRVKEEWRSIISGCRHLLHCQMLFIKLGQSCTRAACRSR